MSLVDVLGENMVVASLLQFWVIIVVDSVEKLFEAHWYCTGLIVLMVLYCTELSVLYCTVSCPAWWYLQSINMQIDDMSQQQCKGYTQIFRPSEVSSNRGVPEWTRQAVSATVSAASHGECRKKGVSQVFEKVKVHMLKGEKLRYTDEVRPQLYVKVG